MSELEYEYALKHMNKALCYTFKNNLSDDEILSIMFEYKYGYRYDVLRISGKCHSVGRFKLTREKQIINEPYKQDSVKLPDVYDGNNKINDIYKNVNIKIRCYNRNTCFYDA